MIKYIFFDNDGILVDTEKHFFRSTRDVLAIYGMELTKERFIELTLKGNEGGWRIARENSFSEEKIDEMRKERNLLYSSYMEGENLLIEGVEETLKQLKNNFSMGIVTSSRKNHFELIHGRTNILSFFNFVLTREDYVKSKPSPEPYLKALEISGCSREECVVVEDSERGLAAAYDAGIKCIVIPNHLTQGSDFSKAWKIIDRIEQLTCCL